MTAGHGFSRRTLLRGTVGAIAVPALALAFPLHQVGARSTDRLRVTVNGLRLRSGPGTGYSVIASLSAGTIVRYLAAGGTANGYTWAKVEVDSTGKVGFAAMQFLGPIDGGNPGGIAVGDMVHVDASGSGGNLRSGPGTGYGVITTVRNGTTGTVIAGPSSGSGYTWFKITFGDVQGWMATIVLAEGGGSDRAWVRVNSGPLNVRSKPGLSGTVIYRQPTGAKGYTTTDMPQDADGYVWVNVQFENGVRGWVAKNYLTWL